MIIHHHTLCHSGQSQFASSLLSSVCVCTHFCLQSLCVHTLVLSVCVQSSTKQVVSPFWTKTTLCDVRGTIVIMHHHAMRLHDVAGYRRENLLLS